MIRSTDVIQKPNVKTFRKTEEEKRIYNAYMARKKKERARRVLRQILNNMVRVQERIHRMEAENNEEHVKTSEFFYQ